MVSGRNLWCFIIMMNLMVCFRLITINTEAKRIIMACNRQGKPPVMKPEDGTNDETKRKSGRAGTSMRCECRCRVNINFHSKMCAWRVTSYEANHNHTYGEAAEDESAEAIVEKVIDGYSISMDQIQKAIQSMERAVGALQPNNPRNTDMDAAQLLADLAGGPGPAGQEQRRRNTWGIAGADGAHQGPQHRHSIAEGAVQGSAGVIRLPAPNAQVAARPQVNIQSQLVQHPHPIDSEYHAPANAGPVRPNDYRALAAKSTSSLPTVANGVNQSPGPVNQQAVPQGSPKMSQYSGNLDTSIIGMRRISEPQVVGRLPISPYSPQAQPQQVSPRVYAQQAQYQQQQQYHQQHLAEMKSVALTAIEIDRYAMLHSQCKRMMSIACKRREWTEDVLAGIGRFLEAMQQSQLQQQQQQQQQQYAHENRPVHPAAEPELPAERHHLEPVTEAPEPVPIQPRSPQDSTEQDAVMSEQPPRDQSAAQPMKESEHQTTEPSVESPEISSGSVMVSPPVSTKEPLMTDDIQDEKPAIKRPHPDTDHESRIVTADEKIEKSDEDEEEVASCLPSPKRQASEPAICSDVAAN